MPLHGRRVRIARRAHGGKQRRGQVHGIKGRCRGEGREAALAVELHGDVVVEPNVGLGRRRGVDEIRVDLGRRLVVVVDRVVVVVVVVVVDRVVVVVVGEFVDKVVGLHTVVVVVVVVVVGALALAAIARARLAALALALAAAAAAAGLLAAARLLLLLLLSRHRDGEGEEEVEKGVDRCARSNPGTGFL